MSIAAISWSWKQELRPTEKFVLIAIADHANDEDFTCWPSLSHLQLKTGFSRPTIWKAIDKLTEIGVLKRVGNHTSGSTMYQISVGKELTYQVSTLPRVGKEVNGVGNDVNKLGNDVTPNHKNRHESSTTINAETSVSARNGVPFLDIVDLYHQKLPELPKCLKLTIARKGMIRQRWNEDLTGLDAWERYFDIVRQSPFLMGKTTPAPGRKPFRADLIWLCKAENICKVIEGKYHG